MKEREGGRERGTGTERGQPLSVCLTALHRQRRAEQVLNHLLLSVHVSDSGKNIYNCSRDVLLMPKHARCLHSV